MRNDGSGNKIQVTSNFAELISPANDGLFVNEGLYVECAIDLQNYFNLFTQEQGLWTEIETDKHILPERIKITTLVL